MTPSTARTLANTVLVAAAVAAAYYALKNPMLRRAATRLTRIALTETVPAALLVEVGKAWVESGRAA